MDKNRTIWALALSTIIYITIVSYQTYQITALRAQCPVEESP